jgi:aquaporin Z
MDKNLRSYLAELAGTFAVVFVSAAAVCAVYMSPDVAARPGSLLRSLYVGLAAGLVYTVALAITIPYEGGYLNPAITLTLWVYKRLDGVKTAGLILVQMLGAAVAGGLLFFIFRDNQILVQDSSLGTPHVNMEMSSYFGTPVVTGALVEFCATFVLTMVIFGTLLDPRAPKLLGPVGKWLAPLWVGLAMLAIVLAAYPLTGAAANPARWFGTFIWEYAGLSRSKGDHLAYWVGPILGALLAGGVYNALLMPEEEEEAAAPAGQPGAKSAAGSTLFRSKK